MSTWQTFLSYHLSKIDQTMQSHRSFISSVASGRCPRCREGNMFMRPTYSTRFMEMRKNCPCCGQQFLLEPGFFLGSAFFSYVINGVLLIAIALTLYYTGREITIAALILSIAFVVFGLLPVTLRVSKSLWIHLFVRYEGPCNLIPRKG